MPDNLFGSTTTPATPPARNPYDWTNAPWGKVGSGFEGGGTPADFARTFNEYGNRQTPQQSGLFQAPNWLYDPQGAVVRAMRMAGMNPASFNPYARAMVRQSDNLVQNLFAKSILGAPGTNPGFSSESPLLTKDLTNNDAMLQELSQMLQGAAQGAPVFGGYRPEQLQYTQPWLAASDAGTLNPSANVVAQYLYDPARAANFATAALYGGMNPQFGAAAAAPFTNLADYYAQLLERGQDQGRSLIDVLLGTPSQNWRF